MVVDEVAAIAVAAEKVVSEVLALLGLVFIVEFVVPKELVTTMCKFASLFVGTEPMLDVPAAQLRLLLALLWVAGIRIGADKVGICGT